MSWETVTPRKLIKFALIKSPTPNTTPQTERTTGEKSTQSPKSNKAKNQATSSSVVAVDRLLTGITFLL